MPVGGIIYPKCRMLSIGVLDERVEGNGSKCGRRQCIGENPKYTYLTHQPEPLQPSEVRPKPARSQACRHF